MLYISFKDTICHTGIGRDQLIKFLQIMLGSRLPGVCLMKRKIWQHRLEFYILTYPTIEKQTNLYRWKIVKKNVSFRESKSWKSPEITFIGPFLTVDIKVILTSFLLSCVLNHTVDVGFFTFFENWKTRRQPFYLLLFLKIRLRFLSFIFYSLFTQIVNVWRFNLYYCEVKL